jgi:hypothetical protein
VPACGADQFLTSNGEGFSCATTSVPTCQADYVLTYNGSAFVCVPKSASIPTCDANQFLTYNGSSFQCAATQNLTVPTCAAGEVLTTSGGNLTCVAQNTAAPSGSWCGLAYRDALFYDCNSFGDYTSIMTCKGSPVTHTCPSGYTLRTVMLGVADNQSSYSRCFRTCTGN